jgi:hypothetical protein
VDHPIEIDAESGAKVIPRGRKYIAIRYNFTGGTKVRKKSAEDKKRWGKKKIGHAGR